MFIFLTPRCYLVRQVKEPLCHSQRGGGGGSVPNKSFIPLYLRIQIKFGKYSVSDSKNHRPQVMSKISPRKNYLNWLARSLVERLIPDQENMSSIPGCDISYNIILPVPLTDLGTAMTPATYICVA